MSGNADSLPRLAPPRPSTYTSGQPTDLIPTQLPTSTQRIRTPCKTPLLQDGNAPTSADSPPSTYPSVYMFIPTAVATNTLGQPVGPATTSWMLPLRLHQVSTIVEGSNITRQLTLSDLRTDCPQTVDPTGIATLDWRCNPVLAAPNEVKSWAWPCNACGRFGLFDPPYAVPTLTGRLVEPTSILVPTITAAPIPTVPTTAAPTTPTVTLPTVVVPTVTTTPPPITAGAATFQINTAFVAAVPALVGMILL